MEGWLNKVGEKGLLNLKRKRWFVLDATLLRLRYFKEKGGAEIGFINLADASRIEENWRVNPKDICGFIVVTRDRRWQLEAESPELRDAWVRGITQCLPASQLKKRMDSESSTRTARSRAVSTPVGYMDHIGESSGGVLFDFEEDFETNSHNGGNDRFGSDFEDDDTTLEDDLMAQHASSTQPTVTSPTSQTQTSPQTTTTTPSAMIFTTGTNRMPVDTSSSRLLATSVPVSIPPRLAQTWHERFTNWSSDDDDDDVEIDQAFEKPHEVVAKTYQEHYLKTGDLQFDVPVSESRKIKALI